MELDDSDTVPQDPQVQQRVSKAAARGLNHSIERWWVAGSGGAGTCWVGPRFRCAPLCTAPTLHCPHLHLLSQVVQMTSALERVSGSKRPDVPHPVFSRRWQQVLQLKAVCCAGADIDSCVTVANTVLDGYKVPPVCLTPPLMAVAGESCLLMACRVQPGTN